MKRILAVLLLLLWASAGFAHDTEIYQGGNVTQIINPSTTGTHTLQTGGADLVIDAGVAPTGSQPKLKFGIVGTDDRVLQIYDNDNTAFAIPIFGGFRSGGTFASPTAVGANLVTSCLGSYPYESVTGAYTPHSGLACFQSAEAITDQNRGTGFFIALSPKTSNNILGRFYVSPGGPIDIKSQAVPFNDYTVPAYLNIEQGSIGAQQPILRTIGTWSNPGTTFTGVLTNITNTNSAAASLIHDWQIGGVSKASIRKDGLFKAVIFGTDTNCSDGTATPADCTAAAAGSVIISAAATAVTVNTTAVTANSQIFIQEDSSLGTKLGVTCNTTTGRTYTVTARTAATSFAITASAAPVTNPACLSYFIMN